jgi:hypothetical protein
LRSESTSPTLRKSNAKNSDLSLPLGSSAVNKDAGTKEENNLNKQKSNSEQNFHATKGLQESQIGGLRESQMRDSNVTSLPNTTPVIVTQPVLPVMQGFIQANPTPFITNFIQPMSTMPIGGFSNYIMAPNIQAGQTYYQTAVPQYIGAPVGTYLAGPAQMQTNLQQGGWNSEQGHATGYGGYQDQTRPSNTQYQYNQSRMSDGVDHYSHHAPAINQGTQTSPTNFHNPQIQQPPYQPNQGNGPESGREQYPGARLSSPATNWRQPSGFGPGGPQQLPLQSSQQSLIYSNSQPTPSFSQTGVQIGAPQGVYNQNYPNGIPKRKDREVNIFKEESVQQNLGKPGITDPRGPAESQSFRKVYTDSTTAVYDNPGFASGQQSSGIGSPSFNPAGGVFQYAPEAPITRQARLSDFRPDSFRDQSAIDFNLSASRAETNRLSARQGTTTPGSVGKSSVAYETLLSRRKQALDPAGSSDLKPTRFPRMKSKQFIYFDLDELTFDKDRSGDNIRID